MGCCILCFLCFVVISIGGCMLINVNALQRNKRFLIFPRQAPTRYQFIGGIGIPADLEYESLTVGHVLKAEYWLPYNATVFRENPFWPEYRNPYNATFPMYAQQRRSTKSTLRWNLYSLIANRLESFGYNGLECVLKAICETSSIGFQRHHDVFAKLIHIILSPSTSADKSTAESSHYKQAEKIGKITGDCDFYDCKISLLNWISRVLNIEI
ncbi:uncharacterized protein LOC118743218 [Rhagoletis pomonella]|uniref:uncharacterized protein LOC118743218 n=1 Tax=Rhagoletis pomonella TaxID=28610 RepID=UPI00177BF6E1|nr:uncharacterized protein LOC118743218 [Rhagoletis pomonella]